MSIGSELQREYESPAAQIKAFKTAVANARQAVFDQFDVNQSCMPLIHQLSASIDEILRAAWAIYLPTNAQDLALAAVGGYGRGELHPYSDVDIMVLVENDEPYAEKLSDFLTFLWDIGLEIGHSVRSVEDCRREAEQDVTVVTNLMETRLLLGDEELFHQMRLAIASDKMWPADKFFLAKREEQLGRYKRFDGVVSRLEPNIKEGPGGLRDIQIIGWVAKRHFSADTMLGLVNEGFLTQEEYDSLILGQEYIWRVRFALHMLLGRREDKLLFDIQPKLAELFGYEEKHNRPPVEHFMQRYYRILVLVERLNEMLLQVFEDNIVHRGAVRSTPIVLNPRFQVIDDYLEVRDDQVFLQRPIALLEIFHLLQTNPQIKGVRANTIRLVRKYRDLIDDKFRADIRARSLFMDILRQPRGITHELRRMNRYGILARYIPAFRKIVGQMQFDLFHAYTVDEHTLMVVRNLRRVACPEFAHELPYVSEVMTTGIPKPELLFLAGLFHDIAKGRGGDHSELGAVDALQFCQDHGLGQADCELVSWLVESHLLMSSTAQRKDISDPDVIHEFAEQMGSVNRLNYLFCLTVADIRGTNPELWNSWRESLLRGLHSATKRALERGLGNRQTEKELIQETQKQAIQALEHFAMPLQTANAIWARFDDDYFLRDSAEEIAWHTQVLANVIPSSLPLVVTHRLSSHGGTTVLVYMKDRDYLFGTMATVLEQLGLTIVDARVRSTKDGMTLDSYRVLDETGEIITDPAREKDITVTLHNALLAAEAGKKPREITCRLSRQMKIFTTPTIVSFVQDEGNNRTAMELVAPDRPGLLASVGKVFRQHQIVISDAKIATVGERAEDVFFITNAAGEAITDSELQQVVRDELEDALDIV